MRWMCRVRFQMHQIKGEKMKKIHALYFDRVLYSLAIIKSTITVWRVTHEMKIKLIFSFLEEIKKPTLTKSLLMGLFNWRIYE